MPREQGSPPEQRPRFTVHEPFMGVTVVQMSLAFSSLLQRFIDEVDEEESVEPELWAFRRALGDPVESKIKYEEKRNRPEGGNRPK